MITHRQLDAVRQQAIEILKAAGLSVRQDEIDQMEVADFGLSELERSGAQIITLVDTDRLAAKLLVMLPDQIEPEHWHPPLGDYPGKEETIRCEKGELYVYGPGEPSLNPKGCPPEHRRHTYTVWHEHVLLPGDQVTFQPNTPHWFQGGPEGAVLWSFSTKAVDVEDMFTDPDVRRETMIGDE
jgi:D-lyxose ketol-isomerase